MSSIQTDKTHTFLSQFDATAGMPAAPARQEAIGALSEIDIPTIRTEQWRYSSLKPLTNMQLKPAANFPESDWAQYEVPNLETDRVVFVNGKYQPQLSDLSKNDDEVCVCHLSELDGACSAAFEAHMGELATADKDVFTAINTAYASEGLVIRAMRDKQVPYPIHIIHINEGDSNFYTQVRNLVIAEPGSEVKLIESFVGHEIAFRNHVDEIIVGEKANLEWIKFQHESDEAITINRTEVKQADNSKCSVFTLAFSGKLVRNNFHLHLNGENTESHVMGLSLLDNDQHVDNFTSIDHREANCFSNELYKGIFNDSASGAFRGRIHVFPDAQKTNAFQTNRNILLSDDASIDTKPQLEIYADDVKCSHAATTGRIEKDALFYLQARGIPELEANKLMIQAFAGEVSQEISMEPVQEYVDGLIAGRF
ncbi:MAG: Fe-S cluster assembly protein SufD [Bacteroidia bacterium]